MDRLERAQQYIAKGDGFYAQAAGEIIAAMEEDPTLSYRKVAERVGKSDRWVRNIVTWSTSADRSSGPFADADNPSKRNPISETRNTLSSADEETLHEVFDALPDERKAEIAKTLTPQSGGYRAPQGPSRSLLAEVEGFHRVVLELADKMAGHWHDKAPLANEEELRLAADTWAETIQEFESKGLQILRASSEVSVA